MLYQNLPDYRSRVRPQPLAPRNGQVTPSPSEEPPHRSRMPKRPLLGFFVVTLISATVFYNYGSPHGIAQAFDSLTGISSHRAAIAKEKRMDTYKSTVNALIAAHPEENIAISTIDLSDSNGLTLGDHGTFTAASTAKLLTAVILMHEVENGRLSLATFINGQTAGSLLRNMIINSDNTAWQSLNDYLTHDTLQTYATDLGWKDYDPDVNTLLPSDMALLAQKLYQGDLLNKEHTSLLLSYMHQANKQEYIVAAVQNLRPNLTVYHKAGWLDGLMHDVAVISDGKQSIVLAIYTYSNSGQGDTAANRQLFNQLTAAALAAYFPATPAQ